MAADILPGMGTTARPRPSLAVEWKHDDHFDPAKHPRDKRGRFISLHDRIDLGGGHAGRVTKVGAGSVTVKRDDGASVTVKGEALKKTTVVDAPGARKPTDAPSEWRTVRGHPATDVSKLQPGDTILTGGDGTTSDPVRLAKPIGTNEFAKAVADLEGWQ